jgi:hypothetical protein
MTRNLTAVLVLALCAPAAADDEKPDVKASVRSWTPIQQYRAMNDSTYGYRDKLGVLVLADGLGDKLSQLGRVALIEYCLEGYATGADAALLWGACSADVAAFDLTQMAAELKAGRIDDDWSKRIIAGAKVQIDKAKKLGEEVKKAASSDRGLAAVVGLGDAARAEWSAFATAHKDDLAYLEQLEDAVRARKNAPMPDCYGKVQPAFAKVLRSTKFPTESDSHPLEFYVNFLPRTTDGYIASLAYGACAMSLDPSGETIYGVLANSIVQINPPGIIRRGPRSLAVAKLFDPSFKPKFDSRDLRLANFEGVSRNIELASRTMSISTATEGRVASVTNTPDGTVLHFEKGAVDACVDWRETTKVSAVGNDGSIHYERTCAKREKVVNEIDDVTVPTVFTAGIAKGVDVVTVANFPVTVWKNNAFVAILGVALKGK